MQSLEMTGFNNVDEVTSPEKLAPNVLTELDNMRLDEEIGIATTRKGFSRYGSQVDSSGTINNIFDVQDATGVNYLLANIATKLRVKSTGSWADLKTDLVPARMRMAIFGDKFIFVGKPNNPFYTNDFTNANSLSITPPDITGTSLSPGSGGSLVSGFYRYVLVYITLDGQRSNPSAPLELFISGSTKATITGIPVSSDARVSKVQIYRTKNREFVTYYLLSEVNNGTTSFDDTLADASLDSNYSPEYLTQVSQAGYISSISDRIVLGNISKVQTNRVLPPAKNALTSFVASGSGGLDSGTYYWAFSLVDLAGNESSLTYIGTQTIASTTADITINNFAMPCIYYNTATSLYELDPNIKYIRLYRTHRFSTIDEPYYFVMDIGLPISMPTITDGINDDGLTVEYPKTTHNPNEVTLLNSTVVYSEVDKYLEFPELNLIQVYPDDPDAITGIFDDDNGHMVFKENSICKIYTVGDPSNWQVQKLVHNLGCDQPDSIYKHMGTYYFVFRNKVYSWSGGGEPKLISYKRKTTFDSVTSFLGCSFYNAAMWYVLTVKIGTSYYLMCYDLKLDCWYKFSIGKADTILEKKFGADAGKLLFGGNTYITHYNDSQAYDSEGGSRTDIAVNLKTKDFTFPDNFLIARLMFFYINYFRLTGTNTKHITFTLTDPVSGNTAYIIDDNETTSQNTYKLVTDGMIGTLKRCSKLNLTVSGEALSKFYASKLEYNIELWRKITKFITEAEIIGVAVDDSGAVPSDGSGNILGAN